MQYLGDANQIRFTIQSTFKESINIQQRPNHQSSRANILKERKKIVSFLKGYRLLPSAKPEAISALLDDLKINVGVMNPTEVGILKSTAILFTIDKIDFSVGYQLKNHQMISPLNVLASEIVQIPRPSPR